MANFLNERGAASSRIARNLNNQGVAGMGAVLCIGIRSFENVSVQFSLPEVNDTWWMFVRSTLEISQLHVYSMLYQLRTTSYEGSETHVFCRHPCAVPTYVSATQFTCGSGGVRVRISTYISIQITTNEMTYCLATSVRATARCANRVATHQRSSQPV